MTEQRETGLRVPANYDEHYLQMVRRCLRWACPIAALSFMGFLGWDYLLAGEGRIPNAVVAVRLAYTLLLLAFWPFAMKAASLRAVMTGLSLVYLLGLICLTGILYLTPDGLVIGIPGLLLITMFACGMFLLRPVPAVICGCLGTVGLYLALRWAHLPLRQQASALVFFAGGVLVSGIFLFLLDRALRHTHSIEVRLAQEQEQSEALLKEILPRYVIQRIRDGAQTIAESMAEVNVIFIDLVGFTELSHRLAPNHVVEVLGDLFREFDVLCERHGVTKIKTIGDGYMAATGVPEPSFHTAENAIEYCFDALQGVSALAARTELPIRVRIGVATGAVISGVLSLKRPVYDLWGETVNLASRLESTGAPDRIHVAETTYWRTKHAYEFEARGEITAKGIGPLQTYFVVGRRAAHVS